MIAIPENYRFNQKSKVRFLIPWTDKDFATRAAKELDPGKPLLVYCRSGRRSAKAAAALVKLGFADVRHVEGGILAWEKAGKPIVKPE